MKKRIISLALAVLIVFCALPQSAWAAQIMSLANVEAGAAINRTITTLPSGDYITGCDSVPPGCEVLTDAMTGAVTLGGVPTTPGTYTFNISTMSATSGTADTITCTISVLPATPIITTSGSVNCYVGGEARLTAAASVADGGQLSYQWYQSANGTNYGGAAIPGATSPDYLADTSRVGVTYYYCDVTNSSAGQTTNAVSAPFVVNVTEAVVDSVMINTMPTKTRYTLGENIDSTGVSVLVRYSDGSQQVVYDGFQLYPNVMSTAGQVSITLTYSGKSCSFPVTVMSEEESISGIGMVVLPDQTVYKQGDTFDPTGLVFRVYYTDGTYKDINSGYTYAPKVFKNSGNQDVTITYKNKTCAFTVSVEAKQTVTTLEIASSPGKLVYNVGDTLDSSGLVLKLTNADGTQIINSGFTCQPTVLNTAGSQAIRVTYGDQVATFTVTVNAAASPTPGVTPTVSPTATVDPSATVAPSPSAKPTTSGHNSRSMNGVLVVIMLVALIALLALGCYMLVMNAGGWDKFRAQLEYKLYKLKNRFGNRR